MKLIDQRKVILIKTIAIFVLFITVISCDSINKKNDKQNVQPEQVRRFFSDDSFWNQPIPKNTEIDSRSDYWISLLDCDPSGENIGLNIESYTIPIYEVNSKLTKFQKIKQTPHHMEDGKVHTRFGHEAEFDEVGVPIPDNLKPSPGADMHVAIVDWEKNMVWDMFLVEQLKDGSRTSATGMVYPLNGLGVFDNADFDVKLNTSIHGHGPGVAAGVPIIAGVIRYDEVKSGEIRHKLCGGLRFVAYQEYVFPSTWTDGNFDGGIPEGATIQLDPNLDLSQFDLTKEEIVVAKALQNYGLVIIDFSEGSTIRAEWLGGQKTKSWKGKLRGWKSEGGIKSIPVKHYRVLKVENVQKGGDRKKEFFMEKLYFEEDSIN